METKIIRSRPRVILAVHVFVWRPSQVLLQRRAIPGYMDGYYGVPSGHVETGERALAAAVRELREECGLTAAEADLDLAGVGHRHTNGEPDDRIDLFYNCRRWTGEPYNAEPAKCDELLWAAPASLSANTIPYIRAALLRSCGAAAWYTETGW